MSGPDVGRTKIGSIMRLKAVAALMPLTGSREFQSYPRNHFLCIVR